MSDRDERGAVSPARQEPVSAAKRSRSIPRRLAAGRIGAVGAAEGTGSVQQKDCTRPGQVRGSGRKRSVSGTSRTSMRPVRVPGCGAVRRHPSGGSGRKP
ncbi:MAG: hypothetical protein IKI21_00105 [Oscillospiraceae bacterium]|nr:hypothetical protein [Oscillospiraceae bacterium]